MIETKKIIILVLFSTMINGLIRSAEVKIASPDSKLQVVVNYDDGKLCYSVNYNGKEFLMFSPLGLDTNIGKYLYHLAIEDVKKNSISESYNLKTIKHSHVNYFANEAVIVFSQDKKPVFDLIFRVSNNDIAFRYKIHSQHNRFRFVDQLINRDLTHCAPPECWNCVMSVSR